MLFRDFANSAFAERFLARRCRPATRERYTELLSKHVLKFFGSMRLDEIGAVEFAAYHAELVRQGKQSRLHLSLVRTVLRAAVRWGELKSLPALPRQRWVRKKPLQAPSTEDVENLVSCATGWLRIAIALAAYAGLSVGEICALKVGDIKSNERRLKVRRMVSGSDGEVLTLDEERVVRIVPALDAVLTDEVDPRRASTLRVVLNPRGHTPCRQNMLTALKRLQAKWGVPAYSFRALRQWHARGAAAGHTKGGEVLP